MHQHLETEREEYFTASRVVDARLSTWKDVRMSNHQKVSTFFDGGWLELDKLTCSNAVMTNKLNGNLSEPKNM
jgi:hypothetical protein